MGHAAHFLERLERASAAEADDALALYRDVPGLAFMVFRCLPDLAAEARVALSLNAADKGPHLVVTREGQFVTCLGRGMAPRGLPVVNHQALTAARAELAEQRRRMQLARELAGSEDLKGLWQRLLAKAEAVSREEFLAVAALQPLLKKRLLVSHLRIADDLAEARELLKKVQRPTAAQAKHLRAFWQSAWFMGDQLVLGCLDGRRGLTQELIRVLSAEGYLAWGVFRQGEQVLALRALWAMGRWGKPLLEGLTAMFSKASTLLSWMYSACGLLMIALRYPQYRRRITDLVTASRPPDILLDHLGKAAGAFAKILVKYRTSPEDLTDLSLQWWRREYVRFQDKVHSPAHLRFATAAEVPEDLALTWGANQEADLMNDPAAPVALLMWLPWLARVEAQELYLPAEVAAVWRTPWRPERALAWVQRYEDHYGPRQPVTVAAVPGRNAPCTCGSGKKYKRCCGAAA